MTVDTRKDNDFSLPVKATEKWHGIVKTNKIRFKPLEKIIVYIEAPVYDASTYTIELYDGTGKSYSHAHGRITDNRASAEFIVGGAPGMQFLKIWFDKNNEDQLHNRLLNVYLDVTNTMECRKESLEAIYPLTESSMLLNRRKYNLPENQVIGYTTADSGYTLDYWLRDMFYNMGGFIYWERDISSGFQAIFDRQNEYGHFPDWVNEKGESARMSSESDVEYIAVMALERVWNITGDDRWLERNLSRIESGIEYLTSDSMRWDTKHGLVKRGHTCDTWDFDIYTNEYTEMSPAVAAICDQSGLYYALLALYKMNKYLNKADKANEYKNRAASLKKRCDEFLWNGEKYLHHLHLDEFDHDSFDESEQLAMGNTWAMTRGLADTGKCIKILDTYVKRWEKTGHRFPWWSLEPGYPAEMGAVLKGHEDYLCPGGYANGGMMPWVGATLALSAFKNGREKLGYKLLEDYSEFLKQQEGKIYTWYWPNMEPGFRTSTPNTTSHDGWSMGHWLDALVEGLAGFRIMEPKLKAVELSPRWLAGEINEAKVTLNFPINEEYFSYVYEYKEDKILMTITGTIERLLLRVMMPWEAKCKYVHVNGARYTFGEEKIDNTSYIIIELFEETIWTVFIQLEAESD